MALGNVQANPDWRKKRVPDMLWLSAMVDVHAGDWQAAHRPLDALHPFVPASETYWMDGRLTTFSLVPPAARAAARRALVEAAPESLVPEFGQALSFFPNSPGAWLFEDWAFEVDHDPDVGQARPTPERAPPQAPTGASSRAASFERTIEITSP